MKFERRYGNHKIQVVTENNQVEKVTVLENRGSYYSEYLGLGYIVGKKSVLMSTCFGGYDNTKDLLELVNKAFKIMDWRTDIDAETMLKLTGFERV